MAEHGLHPGGRARGPVAGKSLTPQSELTTLVGHQLVRDQAQYCYPAARDLVTGGLVGQASRGRTGPPIDCPSSRTTDLLTGRPSSRRTAGPPTDCPSSRTAGPLTSSPSPTDPLTGAVTSRGCTGAPPVELPAHSFCHSE